MGALGWKGPEGVGARASLQEWTGVSGWCIVHREPRHPRRSHHCSTAQAPVPAHGGPAFASTHGLRSLSSWRQGSRGSGRPNARARRAGRWEQRRVVNRICRWRPLLPNLRLIQTFLQLGGWHEEGVEHGHTLGQHGDLQFMLCLEEGRRQQCHGGGQARVTCTFHPQVV